MQAAFQVAEEDVRAAKLVGDPAEWHGGIGDVHEVDVAGQNNRARHNAPLAITPTAFPYA